MGKVCGRQIRYVFVGWNLFRQTFALHLAIQNQRPDPDNDPDNFICSFLGALCAVSQQYFRQCDKLLGNHRSRGNAPQTQSKDFHGQWDNVKQD